MSFFSGIGKALGGFAKDFGGSLISSAFSAFGQERANDRQEELANTAMQRRVKDLKAAGLNPMLAYMSGGAQTPPIQNVAGAAVDSGIRAYSASSSANVNKSMMEQQAATTDNIRAQTKKTEVETAVASAQLPYSANNALTSARILEQQWNKLRQEAASAELDRYSKGFDLEKIKPLLLEYQSLMNRTAEAGLPVKEAEARFFKEVPAAKWLMLLRATVGGAFPGGTGK